jgi:hypothetical protein
MALYGVLGGIQGNREALAAVLAALDARGATRLACLGDIIGYNADPDECVAMLRSRGAVAIAGSQELIALGRRGFGGFSNRAEYALRRTRRALGREAAAYLATLPDHRMLEPGVLLARETAGVPGEVLAAARVCFVGSGHERKTEPRFIHPGTVDASRKRGARLAECALFDSGSWRVEILRVPYDSAATEAKASAFGYRINPLTDRLYSLRRRFSGIVNRSARG